MTTQFLSRVDRGIPTPNYSDVGPGSYVPPSTLSKSLPGFAAFSSSTKRASQKDIEETPAPGSYEIGQSLLMKSSYSAAFKSSTQRFKELAIDTSAPPGPVQSSFKTGKPKKFHQSHLKQMLNDLLPPQKHTPSIPTKFQGYGYEIGKDGKLELQDPVNPGYSGTKEDAVGPLDYDPNVSVKYRNVPKTNFAKGSQRDALDKITSKNTEVPGPGYYNQHSDFDLPEAHGASSNDTDFLMQLNAARKRQSAVFESKTQRDALLKSVFKRQDEPGPGQYVLPSSIKVETKPADKQFFASSGARFQDPMPRSMRIHTAPGSYNIIASDFDNARLKILKQKKMAQRSGWAQNIAFTSTETRFNEGSYDNEVPPPSTYYPKVGMADAAPKPNVRGGAFGSKDERFRAPKSHEESLTRDQLFARELNNDIAGFVAKKSPTGYGGGGSGFQSSSTSSPKSRRPQYTSNFAPSSEDRLRPVKTPPGPAPGSYELQPSWKKSVAVVMAPSTVVSKKVHDPMPGPGQYNISRRITNANLNNPKNIMLSTTSREEKVRVGGPGPQDYDPIPLKGSLIRPSHNVLLSDSYYQR